MNRNMSISVENLSLRHIPYVNQSLMACCLKSPTKNPISNKRCVLAKYLSPQSGSRLLRSITYTAKQFSNVFASGSFRWSQTLLRHLDTHLIHHTADLFLTHACTILNCIICPPVCRGGLKPYGPMHLLTADLVLFRERSWGF